MIFFVSWLQNFVTTTYVGLEKKLSLLNKKNAWVCLIGFNEINSLPHVQIHKQGPMVFSQLSLRCTGWTGAVATSLTVTHKQTH